MDKPILVFINDTPVYIPSTTTVIQACERVGITIPRFCYHDLLEIAGNCRICLVEIKGSPKPQVSCGLPVLDGIHVYTDSPLVKKAREGVIEFLLLNHPLDCPICDQGGECDLQNQAIAFGSTISRFYKYKRGVEDKGLGPLIKTIITRCIHCTRCIRFAWDIAGVEDLGTTLRGNKTEVGTYVQKPFNSEISANVIDLCPVGALTSKVYAFKARPWEVVSHQNIDTTDSLGSNINIDTKQSKILRVSPRTNIQINLEWLSDKARYSYQGNTSQRLGYPYFKTKKRLNKKSKTRLVPFKSSHSIKTIVHGLLAKSPSFKLKLGRNLDNETLTLGKSYFRKLGGDVQSETLNYIPSTIPAFFQSTLTLDQIEDSTSCLLLGVNPRTEATLANVRLRSRFKEGLFNLYSLGNSLDLTYKSKSSGLSPNHLVKLCYGKNELSLDYTPKPLLIYGDSVSSRYDGFSMFSLGLVFQKARQNTKWFGIYRFPLGSNSIGKSFFGLSQSYLKLYKEPKSNQIFSYLIGLENKASLNIEKSRIFLETSHINFMFKKCKFIAPIQSVLEKTGHFINCFGLVQKNKEVLRFGVKPFKVLDDLIIKLKPKAAPKSFNLDYYGLDKFFFYSRSSKALLNCVTINSQFKVGSFPLKTYVGDMYKTDLSSASSMTLAKVSANLRSVYWHFM